MRTGMLVWRNEGDAVTSGDRGGGEEYGLRESASVCLGEKERRIVRSRNGTTRRLLYQRKRRRKGHTFDGARRGPNAEGVSHSGGADLLSSRLENGL